MEIPKRIYVKYIDSKRPPDMSMAEYARKLGYNNHQNYHQDLKSEAKPRVMGIVMGLIAKYGMEEFEKFIKKGK